MALETNEAAVMIFYNLVTQQVLLETRTSPSNYAGIAMLPAETVEELEGHVDALYRGAREEFGVVPGIVIPRLAKSSQNKTCEKGGGGAGVGEG